MLNGILFHIFCLLVIATLTALYFSKKKIDTKETRFYSFLLVTNLIGILLHIGCYITIYFADYIPITNLIITKSYIIYIIIWTMIFSLYVCIVLFDIHGKFVTTCAVINVIASVIFIVATPLYYYHSGDIVYTYGPLLNKLYLVFYIIIGLFIAGILVNLKRIISKKYVPLYIMIILGACSAALQQAYPEILLLTALHTFVTFVMYFTIENPDLAMITQLNIAREQADRANNAKSEFLSSMSHEIRTPLNAIVGFSQALAEEDLSPQAEDEVKDIMMASETLLELVNGILDISKIEASKLEIVCVEYNFKDMLDELSSLTRARLGEKPLDLRFNFASDLPKYLYGDKVRVKQVILNLLTNSVKYTKEGWVDFTVNCIKKNGICRLIVSVEDSGIGIKLSSIDKLFSKFERLDIEKNNTIEGTGLGLAITKKLVDLMGGKIVVQSIYGKGSKFTLIIDQKIVDHPTDTSLELTQTLDVEKIKALDLTGKRILVVDDNKINLKVATRLLSDYKCIIETFDNGFSCVEKHEVGAHYDLILMDDMMPKMSGVETFHKLKEIEGFNTPVVALTANAISGMREKYLAEGFDDYLSKPIDKKELQKVLNKFLGNKNV